MTRWVRRQKGSGLRSVGVFSAGLPGVRGCTDNGCLCRFRRRAQDPAAPAHRVAFGARWFGLCSGGGRRTLPLVLIGQNQSGSLLASGCLPAPYPRSPPDTRASRLVYPVGRRGDVFVSPTLSSPAPRICSGIVISSHPIGALLVIGLVLRHRLQSGPDLKPRTQTPPNPRSPTFREASCFLVLAGYGELLV